jgi:hypothetical protein
MKLMCSFLSKGVAVCQRGFERVADEAKASLEEKKLLESENRTVSPTEGPKHETADRHRRFEAGAREKLAML